MRKNLLILGVTAGAALTMVAFGADDKAKSEPEAKAEKPAKPEVKEHPTGYTDTPFLPGGKWRVHDDMRPRPEVVTPGAAYGDPPSDAIVLFDGTDLSAFTQADGSEADWIVKDGYMEVSQPETGKGNDVFTKQAFGDIQLHIEWASPAEVVGNSQGRGNSGIFFFEQYELQVLDSFENKSYADGQASAIYGYKPPLVNACRKPGEWQTYDIIFEAPQWDSKGNLSKRAYITVLQNGVLTHHHQDYLGASGHKKVAEYVQHDPKGRIKLQNHRNPVRYRNIWVRELDLNANE